MKEKTKNTSKELENLPEPLEKTIKFEQHPLAKKGINGEITFKEGEIHIALTEIKGWSAACIQKIMNP